jgi:hypothetical protein
MSKPNAPQIVADALSALPMEERSKFLLELLDHTAAGLVIIDGQARAVDACRQVTNAVVGRRA